MGYDDLAKDMNRDMPQLLIETVLGSDADVQTLVSGLYRAFGAWSLGFRSPNL